MLFPLASSGVALGVSRRWEVDGGVGRSEGHHLGIVLAVIVVARDTQLAVFGEGVDAVLPIHRRDETSVRVDCLGEGYRLRRFLGIANVIQSSVDSTYVYMPCYRKIIIKRKLACRGEDGGLEIFTRTKHAGASDGSPVIIVFK